MSKWLKLAMGTLLVCCMTAAVYGCAGGEREEDKETGIVFETTTEADVNVLKGEGTDLAVTVKEDGQAVTEGVTWTSSDTAVATVADGTVTGVAHGEATVTVAYGGEEKEFAVTVYDVFVDSEEDWISVYDYEGESQGNWYLLTADITLTKPSIMYNDAQHEFTPVFTGRVNGDGHKITYSESRLFGNVKEGAVIENLVLDANTGFYWGSALCWELNASTVRNIQIDAEHVYDIQYVVAEGVGWIQAANIGGVIYYAANGSVVENVTGTVDFSSLTNISSKFGAVVGLAENSTIKDCSVTVYKPEGVINTIKPVASNTDSEEINCTATNETVALGEYTYEYYIQDGDGWVKSEENSGTKEGPVGHTVILPQIAIEGYTFDAENENNVMSAIVAEDGSTVLKAYYTKNA